MTRGRLSLRSCWQLPSTLAEHWQVQDWRYGEKLAGIEKAQTLAIEDAGNVAREEEQRRQASAGRRRRWIAERGL